MSKVGIVRLPLNGKVEFEATAGVWTDITADVDLAQSSMTMRFGRVSALSAPQVAQFTVVLRNFDKVTQAYTGKYAPHNQASPFWPSIQPNKRIRYSYNPGVQRFRFTGYIQSWQPLLVDAFKPYVQITAVDRLDQLQRVNMLSPLRQEITLDSPSGWWPLTDATGSTQAMEQSGVLGKPLAVFGAGGSALTFGNTGLGFGEGTSVQLLGGWYLSGAFYGLQAGLTGSQNTFEALINTVSATDGAVVSFSETTKFGQFQVTLAVMGASNAGKPRLLGATLSANINGATAVNDGVTHHLAVTYNAGTWTLYVDGVSAGTTSGAISPPGPNLIRVGESDTGSTSMRYTGNIQEIVLYSGVLLSTTRIAAHAAAGLGYYGDRTDQRIARFLGYAGLTTSDWNLDTGQALVNTYPQDGRDALTACQDMAATEGGGAVLYATPDGKVRFANRRYRDSRTPVLTLDMVNDLDTGTYSPSFDQLNLVTQVTVDRSSQPGSVTSQTYSKGTSYPSPATTYTTTDQDALNLAQYLVSSQATPGFRFPQIAVDLATAFNNLYDQVGQLQIGDRIRLTNIPATAYPQTTIDFFVEGWTETVTAGGESYLLVFDVTAADMPARAKADTTHAAPTAGSMTLNSSITSSGTTVVIASTDKTWTTTGGQYPVIITIGEEDLTLTSAPGGSTSPQTFTGVTRGVNGTTAAAQTSGAAVTLAATDAAAL